MNLNKVGILHIPGFLELFNLKLETYNSLNTHKLISIFFKKYNRFSVQTVSPLSLVLASRWWQRPQIINVCDSDDLNYFFRS